MWEDGLRKSDIALELCGTSNIVNLGIEKFQRQGNVNTLVSHGRLKMSIQEVDVQIVEHVRYAVEDLLIPPKCRTHLVFLAKQFEDLVMQDCDTLLKNRFLKALFDSET